MRSTSFLRTESDICPPELCAGCLILNKIQSSHCSRRGGELVHFKAHPLKHRHKEVGERVIVLLIESQVLAMLKPATSKDGGEVGGDVSVSVSEIRAVQDHCAIQQRLSILANSLQLTQQGGQQFHMPLVNGFKLRELGFGFSMVRQIVVAISDFDA